jgi:hypothetical protein
MSQFQMPPANDEWLERRSEHVLASDRWLASGFQGILHTHDRANAKRIHPERLEVLELGPSSTAASMPA